ncbi:MAG: peptidoglycan-associated lipoprotein Pal [Bdellovibrionaceae bacterium]|nr:peptidoglycan-associated lipoprotein Pal [Pseudobdellovibrionaceae bacterium]
MKLSNSEVNSPVVNSNVVSNFSKTTTQTLKQCTLLLVFSSLVWSCASKTKTDVDQSQAAVTESQPEAPVEATPMNFDAQGSDSGKVSGLVTVNFEYDKSSLSADAKKKLQQNANWINANPKAKVQIEGHCDARGSIEYNLALGERRANSVKNYLGSLGVAKDRLSTISYGEEKPLTTDETESAYAKNRRANFVPSNQ